MLKDIQKIKEFIKKENNLQVLRQSLIKIHPYDLAQTFVSLKAEERLKIYASLNDQELANLFSYLEIDDSADYLEELDIQKGASVLEHMEVDDATDILLEIDNESQVKNYLNLIESETRDELSYLSSHDEDLAGSIMTTSFIKIDSHLDIKEAMKILVQEANETEVIDPIYVCENNKLVGIIPLKELIIARSPNKIKDIMKTKVIAVDVNHNAVEAAEKIRDYGLSSLPVLDNENLVGIITIDDAMDIIEDNLSHNYVNLAAVAHDLNEENNPLKSLGKRLPWLIGLLILGFFTSAVISGFEGIIGKVTALVLFQSLILSVAGNIGTQSLAVTIRGLSRGDLLGKVSKNLLQELKISLVNSFLLAILSFIVAYSFLWLSQNDTSNLIIATVLAISMFITLNASSLLGVLIPVFFSKVKINPAIASGPLITTIIDILAVFIYYGLATLMFNSI